jgi:hypothetical protein
MTRQTDFVIVDGINGDSCCISPPHLSWGPELAPGSTGLFAMPIQSNWVSYAYGQRFQSWKPKRRDVVFTVNIRNPDTGSLIDQDSDVWHSVYSRWRAMWSPEEETTIRYVSIDGERTLGLREIDAPKPFSANNFEGQDPHLFAFGSLVASTAAEFPAYVGIPDRYQWSTTGSGNFAFTMPYFNPSSLDIWPEWDLTGGAQWVLPDYSFGKESYGRGVADTQKTVPIPTLMPGENVTVATRPDYGWILSAWETPVTSRSPGLRSEYPIPPGRGSSAATGTGAGCVVQARNVISGAACRLTLPRWYAEPFSTPRLA